MIDILKNVHIVLGHMRLNKYNSIVYINNYIDWNSYNILYDLDFMKKIKKSKTKFWKNIDNIDNNK